MAKRIRTKEERKKSRRIGLRIFFITILTVIALILGIDRFFNSRLIKYIKTFEPVDYTGVSRAIPEFDESLDHYSISSEDGLNIMMLTDIHLGGGRWSYKKDLKTIYEIITMLQKVKPDLVILDGDNTFACPGPKYNGGGTLNNKMVARVLLELFEHEDVYFTTVFGNHDSEVFDLYSRQKLADFYASDKYKHCIIRQEFTDSDAKQPSVTNQILTVKNGDGDVNKLLLLIDSNAYVDKSIKAVLDWNYDVVHQAQVDWAKEQIKDLSANAGYPMGSYLDTVAFMHIPLGEFQTAYKELEGNGFKDTENTHYITGVWDEEIDETLGIRIWYGGCTNFKDSPDEADTFFETLGPDGIDTLEAIFFGHDHANNVAVDYMGVNFVYGMSIDNNAYDDIAMSGLQRGCTLINIDNDGTMTWEYENAYTDLGVSTNEFIDVYLDHYYYEGQAPQF